MPSGGAGGVPRRTLHQSNSAAIWLVRKGGRGAGGAQIRCKASVLRFPCVFSHLNGGFRLLSKQA